MDDQLLVSIQGQLRSNSRTAFLPQDKASSLIDEFGDKHVTDRDQRWWWSSLSSQYQTITAPSNLGIKNLSHLFSNEERLFLVLTDDEFPPWPVISGPFQDLVSLIDENRFFEYFVTSEDLNRFVFDTHQNELVYSV